MVNKRAMKALSEIMEYLDGEDVEAMKGGLPEGDEDGGAVAVLEVEAKDKGADEGAGSSEEAEKCANCGFSTLGANYCPGCGEKLHGEGDSTGGM